MISTRGRHWAFCVLALIWGPAGLAHTVITETSLPAGTVQFVTFLIAHGCGSSPTTGLRILIPNNVMRVTAGYMPGWRVERKVRKLDAPYKMEDGTVISETVSEIAWIGGAVPDGLFAEFRLRVSLPNTPGKTLYFKAIQKCEQGEVRWIETPRSGQADYDFGDPRNAVHEAKDPAPFLKLSLPPQIR